MSEFCIYSITDPSTSPSKLLRREDGNRYYQHIPVPLPDNVVVFALGCWPSKMLDKKLDVQMTYEGEEIHLGSIGTQNRSLCWEKKSAVIPEVMAKPETVCMFKLQLMFEGSCDSQLTEQAELIPSMPESPAENSIETKDAASVCEQLTQLKDEEKNIQDINESTPDTLVMVKTPIAEKTNTSRSKRRTGGKFDKTPTGPTPKKQKIGGTRMRALNSEFKQASNKENIGGNVGNKKKSAGSDRLSICKDVTSRGHTPSSRWGHTLCAVNRNMAVLVGGQRDKSLSKDSVWCLDPETRKWRKPEVKSENQRPEYRMGHTTTYDPMLRCIYVYGGSKNLKWYRDVHMLDMEEWRWQLVKTSGKAPTRAYHTSTLYRHEVWVFGGVYPRPDPQPDGCSNDIHIFSPMMENWYSPLVQGEKPLPRSGHSSTLIKDKLVVFGGWDAPVCYNDLHILDMSLVEWSQPKTKGTPPVPRSWHASCSLSGDRIVVHGGYDGNLALDDTHIFSLDTLSWARIKVDPIPTARAGHVSICLPYSHENQEEDEILIFGGGDNDGAFFDDLLSVSIPFQPELENFAKECQ